MSGTNGGPDSRAEAEATPALIVAMARACSEIATEAGRIVAEAEVLPGDADVKANPASDVAIVQGPPHWHAHLMPVTAPELMRVPSEDMLDEIERWLRHLGIDAVDRTPLLRGGDPFYVVTGMHRSGTSAVTAAIAEMGVSLTQAQDLMPGDEHNPLGYFESTFLSTLNEALMKALYGDWFQPVDATPILVTSEDFAPVRALMARALSTVVTGPGPVVWKDPRLSVLLPVWRQIVRRPSAAVLVYRHPVEVSQSLQRRDGFGAEDSFRLWEVYNRTALSSIAGMSALIVRYEDLVTDPYAWVEEIARFVAATGAAVPQPLPEPAYRIIQPHLRHARVAPDPDGNAVPASLDDLLTTLDSLRGAHENFVDPRV